MPCAEGTFVNVFVVTVLRTGGRTIVAAPFGRGGVVVVHPSVYYGWSVCSRRGFSEIFVRRLLAKKWSRLASITGMRSQGTKPAMLPSRPSFLPQPGPISRVDETRQTHKCCACGRHIILVGLERAGRIHHHAVLMQFELFDSFFLVLVLVCRICF